ADLVARIEQAVGLQRAMDSRQNAGELVARDVQQAGAGPDAVIGLALVQLIEQQRLHRMVEALRGNRGHLRRAVRGAHVEATRQHLLRMVADAAAELEDRARLRQHGKKADQPRRWRFGPAGIGFGVAAIELQRVVVHWHCLTETARSARGLSSPASRTSDSYSGSPALPSLSREYPAGEARARGPLCGRQTRRSVRSS